MTNTVAPKPCWRSTGSACRAKSAYPSSNVSPTRPFPPPAARAASRSLMDTPRSPRRASQRICCANRGGLTVTRYGSAWYGSIE